MSDNMMAKIRAALAAALLEENLNVRANFCDGSTGPHTSAKDAVEAWNDRAKCDPHDAEIARLTAEVAERDRQMAYLRAAVRWLASVDAMDIHGEVPWDLQTK